ncbi:hypothetical protein AGMMS49587_16680 [Spirochaetia bacterium]|nr:hypothetical protein AGMMS49587_16680 [Spirochaetia bacterium]
MNDQEQEQIENIMLENLRRVTRAIKKGQFRLGDQGLIRLACDETTVLLADRAGEGPDVPVYPLTALAVFNEYPQFGKDLPLLKEKVITDTDIGYKWEKSKVSLSQYFGYMGHKPTPWKLIENLFNETDLKNSFSSNGGSYGKKKPSPDYLEIKKILENTPDS